MWGKVIGAVIGLRGGVPGVLAGVVLGHLADRKVRRLRTGPQAAAAVTNPDSAAYRLLNVSPADSTETIHAAWRQKCRDHHPDRLSAAGASPEDVAAASQTMAGINAAYDHIRRLRGEI